MLRRLLQSFLLALQNIRSNFFHTFLSVLGIVIGVAALVSILSLIDGMWKFAKDQIATTTSLNMISVASDHYKHVNGITIRKDSVTFLSANDLDSIRAELTLPSKCYMFQRTPKELSSEGDSVKIAAYATGVIGLEPDSVLAGQSLSINDVSNSCVVTESLAKSLAGKGPVKDVIGREIIVGNRVLKITGVIYLKFAQGSELFFPFALLSKNELKNNTPQLIIEAENVIDVPKLKGEVQAYLTRNFGDQHDFRIATNEQRVEQAAKGFLLFKVIMGLIVGISVVVGGVGVMNVLLISVTQRTMEIGIRKAVGANRRDIMLLFLSESITVSAFGSFMGLIFGTLFTMAAVPIVTNVTKIPFYASYTWDTFMIISLIAIVVGVVFGTYPAIRASKLDPVEAIRHE